MKISIRGERGGIAFSASKRVIPPEHDGHVDK
jgi:hypothetical protein